MFHLNPLIDTKSSLRNGNA